MQPHQGLAPQIGESTALQYYIGNISTTDGMCTLENSHLRGPLVYDYMMVLCLGSVR